MKKVLIVYGTRYGATRDTSEKVRDILTTEEIEVDLVDIDEAEPSLSGYDGVLIGTGIKMGMWTKKIKKFIKKQKNVLKEKQCKSGFFINCGTASRKEKIKEAKEKYIDKKLQDMGINFDIADAFGPIYDFSETSVLSNMSKKIMRAGLIDEGWEKVDDILYDLRDMDQIQKFAEDFTKLI